MNDSEVETLFLAFLCLLPVLAGILAILSPLFSSKMDKRKTLQIILSDKGNRILLFFAFCGLVVVLLLVMMSIGPIMSADYL